MELIVLFGLAGSGKTYIGKLLEKEFGYHFYEGDSDLTLEMKTAIKNKQQFNKRMRDLFFTNLTIKVQLLVKEHLKLVISQAFFFEENRNDFQKVFPNAQFLLIETSDAIRFKRLLYRRELALDLAYVKEMDKYFEKPESVPIVINNAEGDGEIIKQLKEILS